MSQLNQMNQTNPSPEKQGNLSSMLMLRFSGSGTAGQTKRVGMEGAAVKTAASGTTDGFDAVLKERMTTVKADNGTSDAITAANRKDHALHSTERETRNGDTPVAQKRNMSVNGWGKVADSDDNGQKNAKVVPDSEPVKTAMKSAKSDLGEPEEINDENGEIADDSAESPLEALNQILQAMLALAAEMTKPTETTVETDPVALDSPVPANGTVASTVTHILADNTKDILPAETAKTLLDLLTQAAGEADASLSDKLGALLRDAGGKPVEFLQKLADLLQQAGVGTEALKSLSVKLQTVAGGDAVMLKLNAVAEGIRVKLHAVFQTGETAEPESAGTEAQGAIPVVEGMGTASEGSVTENRKGGDTSFLPDENQTTENKTDKATLSAEAETTVPATAATAAATAAATGSAAAGQQAGAQNALSANRTIHTEPIQNAQQTARAHIPTPLADPLTSLSVTGQLTAKVSELTGDARHEMELQLKPESLGKINLKLIEEKGQILARFTAESEQVRAILESNMQLLKDALEKSGLSVQQLSVSVGQQSARGRQDGQEDGDKGNGRGNAFGAKGILVSTAFGQQGAHLSVRMKDYLNGPNATISLKA